MRLIQILASVGTAVLATNALAASDRVEAMKQCVAGLQSAAYEYHRINKLTTSESDVRTAFCEAVKHKQSGKSETDLSVLAKSFYLSLTQDQSTLSDYDRNYCSRSSSVQKFFDSSET